MCICISLLNICFFVIFLFGALAFRVRAHRIRLFEAFRASQKPSHVKFADGREGRSQLMLSRKLYSWWKAYRSNSRDHSDATTLYSWGFCNLHFLFDCRGLCWRWDWSAEWCSCCKENDTKVPETKARIEKAFRGFRADVLRKEADLLMRSRHPLDLGFENDISALSYRVEMSGS